MEDYYTVTFLFLLKLYCVIFEEIIQGNKPVDMNFYYETLFLLNSTILSDPITITLVINYLSSTDIIGFI